VAAMAMGNLVWNKVFGTPILFIFIILQAQYSYSAPVDTNNLNSVQKEIVKEHVYGGFLSTENIYIRKGYVLCFNPMTNTPNWVAYHIIPEYRNVPKRKGKFATFRNDPDISNEATDDDYKGLFSSRGFARGHLAPYAVMGGDRDHDGKTAQDGDEDDIQTIYQSNYLSNIVPQHHYAFNGSPGVWRALERWIQDYLVADKENEVWVFAGCIFGSGEHEKIGKNNNIWVPPLFYKIVIMENPDIDTPIVLAFLFPHHRSVHGDISDFLVTVYTIEALSGLDFFRNLNDQSERWLEDQDIWNTWERLYSTIP
jgi:endonuclease G